MNNTKNVIQVQVNIEGISSVQVLKDKLQSAIGNVSIVRYAVTPKNAILYIEVIPTNGLATFQLEVDDREFSLINVVEDIVNNNPAYTEGSVQEAFAEQKIDDPLPTKVILFYQDPLIGYFLTENIKLSNISTYNGLVSITTDKGKGLVLIEKCCNVFVDYSTYNKDTGTVRLIQLPETDDSEFARILSDFNKLEKQFQDLTKNEKSSNDVYTKEEMEELNQRISDSEERKKAIIDEYLVHQKRVPLSNIEVYNGVIQIFDKDNEIILLQDEYELDYDRNSLDPYDGTVIIIRTDKKVQVDDNIRYEEPIDPTYKYYESCTDRAIKKAFEFGEESSQIRGAQQIKDIINIFDAIENNKPYKLPKQSTYLQNEYEKNVTAMKDLLQGVYAITGQETSMASALKSLPETEPESTITVESYSTIATASVDDTTVKKSNTYETYLEAMTIGDTVIETIKLQVALISFSMFDEYAAKHNIVGWDLNSPTTLKIKYMEGVTSDENITKFHEMMDSLDPGWVQKDELPIITSKFVSELKQIIDRDLVQEFLNRVNKHNTFVRESTAKIRKALLDMETDFNSLKDDVNLIIDWEQLTAHASRKERTETRTSGVKELITDSNLVKVNTGLKNSDFYIPFELITDELRSKYVLDNQEYYITDAPSFAFYEVQVNGHVMLIEKTDL
jgi:uncharacterized protein YdcH (DUF465 family)